ncbi:Response regulator protein VraR [Baekduia alba]|uniref:response regulator transcription factor n=1 Tax=Baekduia alba TaxID=2997333 RepID=UPI00233FBB81|nr:response regulator transcription factor [Baekduia alba]WCB95335.1 Response regulator protein VraR [Baekduia alba]
MSDDATAPRATRVLVMHNSELVRVGCRALLARQPWAERVVVAAGIEEAVAHAARYKPDVALIRVDQFTATGSVNARLRAARPLLPIVLMVEQRRVTHRDALAVGAVGAIDSTAPASELIDALQRAAAGEEVGLAQDPRTTAGLSERELQVIAHLSTGARNSEIGSALLLSPQTIKHHVRSAYRKLGVHTRLEAVMRAQQLGLLG